MSIPNDGTKMTLGEILEMMVAECLEDEVKVITDGVRKFIPELDQKIKEMGLDTFDALVYDAMVKVADRKRHELAARVRKTQKRF